MTKLDELNKIFELISSGQIPKEIYNKYLSDCKFGFMNEEDIKKYFGDMPPFIKQDCEGCYEYRKLQQENKELSRMCELYSKSLYNAELKQLQQEKKDLIKYLEDKIEEINNYKRTIEYKASFQWKKCEIGGRLSELKKILARAKENK